jgi:DUF971 family protein
MKSTPTRLEVIGSEVVNDYLLLQWSDGVESVIALRDMRDQCPCANCAGETDALGNVYRGPAQPKTAASYQLVRIDPVGYYALRPVWGDGHDAGIFTYQRLRKLGKGEGNAISET